jgi:MFS family permease
MFDNRTSLAAFSTRGEFGVGDGEQKNWGAIGIVYAITVLSMAFVGTAVPLLDYLGRSVGATAEGVGFAVALFSAPSALLAGIGGGLIDRVGARAGLIAGGMLAITADALVYAASSLAFLDAAFLISGLGFAAITVAGPALMMEITSGPRRFQAMSVWSTYPPAGLSVGLLIAAPFADAANWRWALTTHGLLIALATATCIALPRPARAGTRFAGHGGGLTDLVSTFREVRVLRLAVAACLPAAIAYGTTLIVPSYLAHAHQLSLSTASSIVAVSNLATILGGLAAGQVLARNASPFFLYAMTVATGIMSQAMIFIPGGGFALAIAGLIIWTFTIGGSIAITMSLLPHVVRDPMRGAAASGLVGQFISAASFLVPGLYFGVLAGGGAAEFVMLAAAALVISLVALPAWPARVSGNTRPGVAPPI